MAAGPGSLPGPAWSGTPITGSQASVGSRLRHTTLGRRNPMSVPSICTPLSLGMGSIS
jgi:hypothetical protein